ncbi:MAG TPA: bifunctional DNA-formamidopyrimidine glycosylase/DNA-(apurinic or apyrimidinic site) lyase [Polyangia bacterium]|nr:bifunctional DNA-formamidopyrimidine glycosylase/DNA-(apurinic or apyrimidinic site) lyase [Polyangia bacterium]
MPELPEVETIVRGLGPALRGRRVTSVWSSGLGLRLARAVDVAGLRAVSVGRAVADVRRQGKYILVVTDARAGEGVCVHLGMTGRLRVQRASEARAPHTHVVFSLAGGGELRYVDARRFGWVAPGAPLASLPALAELGPDPLGELDAAGLSRALAGVRAPIKAFLLDQTRVAGLGNIYVCEALFGARIHPRTPAGRVRGRAPELLAAIRRTLEGGIARRGTTLRDYVDADGFAGDNAVALLVYGREGEPCPACGAAIRRRVDAARSTFYCPRCQPARVSR